MLKYSQAHSERPSTKGKPMNLSNILIMIIASYIFAEIFLYMWKESFEKTLPYKLAWFFRFASWVWEPRVWGCEYCGLSSRLVDFHGTTYESWGTEAGQQQLKLFEIDQPDFIEPCGGSRALQILCEHCWEELSTTERWAIYQDFLNQHPRDDESFMRIYQATMAGK